MNLLAFFLVIPLRFERKTHALEGRCSIQLSYGTSLNCGAKVRFYFKTAILLGEKNKKHYIFSLKTTYIPLFKSTLLINYYKKETMQNENPKIIMYICIYNRKNA